MMLAKKTFYFLGMWFPCFTQKGWHGNVLHKETPFLRRTCDSCADLKRTSPSKKCAHLGSLQPKMGWGSRDNGGYGMWCCLIAPCERPDTWVTFLWLSWSNFGCWPPRQENNFSVATLLLSLSGTGGGPNLTYSGCSPPKVCLKE